MVLLTPEWWGGTSPTHDEIIEVARSWGPCRVLTARKRVSQRTRIYFPHESQLLMFRIAFGERIWKLYRLVS